MSASIKDHDEVLVGPHILMVEEKENILAGEEEMSLNIPGYMYCEKCGHGQEVSAVEVDDEVTLNIPGYMYCDKCGHGQELDINKTPCKCNK